ncbi:MAG: hypothetical protein ACREQ9_23345, partial [Candidatus Binatia bacterium]
MRTVLFVFALTLSAQSAFAQSPCCATGDDSMHPDIIGRACNQAGEDQGIPGCAELDQENCIGGGPALNDPMEQFVFGFCVCLGGDCFSDGGSGDLGEATPRECTRDAL